LARLAETAARHDILRMKGFADVTGKPMRLLVQGVGQRFQHAFDRAWRAGEPRQGRLVVIGEKGLDRDAIRDMILSG
jgi:cobalamin biosynthesis protein CobW